MSSQQKPPQQPVDKAELIEKKIDREITSALAVSNKSGGALFRTADDVMEYAKLMAIAAEAVPPHCRSKIGVCLGIVMRSIHWDMDPFAVANQSYVVNDRISYESQIIHAVIEQRAPIVGRLKHSFSGEGAKRKCKVWATTRDDETLEWESPEIAQIKPKNSPLWAVKPDLQLYYNTSRDWARAFFPDVIHGVYSKDELQDGVIDAAHAPAATPLPQPASRVEQLRNRMAAKPTTPQQPSAGPEPEPEPESPQVGDPQPTTPPDESNIEVLLEACQSVEDCRRLAARVSADESLGEQERNDWLYEINLHEQALADNSQASQGGDGQLFPTSPNYD